MTSRRAKGDSKNGISSKKIIFIKGINTVKNQKLDFEKNPYAGPLRGHALSRLWFGL